MATTTPSREIVGGARRVDLPAASAARHRRRVLLAAACYVGMALLVLLAVAMARVLPAAIGVPAFVVLAATLVVIAHPALRITHRR